MHSGFLHDWEALAAPVFSALTALGCENGTVAVTGHSLGSAVSVLAAFNLTASGSPWAVSRVYTYGQPRVGNVAFVDAVGARLQAAGSGVPYYRVVEYRDAVPHLPMHDMFREGWAHLAPEVYYHATALGAYTVCTDAKDKRCSYQWNMLQTLTHTCDHCSYLGMNPCDCKSEEPRCAEPHALAHAL